MERYKYAHRNSELRSCILANELKYVYKLNIILLIVGLIGGAWIYGKVDDKGDFTGHNVAYVNQDLKTIYVGTFENGLMVR